MSSVGNVGNDELYRYPFPPYPTGWYLLCRSDELAPGEVLTVHYFGRELVAYRTESGEAVVVDAHCPHLGAHLGYGGAVVGESIRCPFHAWRFDTAGSCVEVPYLQSRNGDRAALPKVGLRCWTVAETSGLIHVHYSDHGQPPTWPVPDIPDWGQPGWVGYVGTGWTVKMHVQELAENVPDTAHFLVVHGLPTQPVAEISTEDHIFHQRTVMGDDWYFTQDWYGLWLIWLRIFGPVTYWFRSAITPIDETTVDLRLLFYVDAGEGATELSPTARQHIDATIENTARDIPIWEHKVYREKAPLVPGDGPLNALRHWATQFYETAEVTSATH